jgi:hypothetical protein
MTRLLAFLLCLLLFAPAWAQQLSQPAPANSVPSNAVLTASSTAAFPNGVWRNSLDATSSAPPLFFKPSPSACPLYAGAGDNGSQVKSGDNKCWLAVPPVTGYAVSQFGAKNSATAAVNNQAINDAVKAGCNTSGMTGGTLPVLIDGQFSIDGTVGPLNCSGASLLGIAPYVSAINCTGTGTADCVQLGAFPANPATNCTGSSQPGTCLTPTGNRIANLAIDARTRTGGYAISINGAAEPRLDNLLINGWKVLNVTYVGHAYINNITSYMWSTNAADYGINLYNLVTTGSGTWYKADIVSFSNFTIRSLTQGGANCMLMDGPVETIWINSMALLACRNGLDILNTQAQTVEGFYPTFIYARDLEIDGATNNAVNINAGRNMVFSEANWNANAAPVSCAACRILNIAADSAKSNTSTITISDSELHNGPAAAAYIQALDVTFNNVRMHDLCWVGTQCAAAGGDSAVQIFSGSTGIRVVNSVLAPMNGDFHASKIVNGVYLNSGVLQNIIIANNDYRGTATTNTLTSNIINSTSNPVSFYGGIGWNSAPITASSCALFQKMPGSPDEPGVGTRC